MTNINGRNGFLLMDGAHLEDAVVWLYQNYPSHQPMPLLLGTPYEPIAEAGPILLDAPMGSPAYQAWAHVEGNLSNGLWLQTQQSASQVFNTLQRRIRIYSPDRREFWLRLGDATPMRQAWLAGAIWPIGFWHGIDCVWVNHEGTAKRAWVNEKPKEDCAPNDSGINAQIVLTWPLLEALAPDTDTSQEVV